MGEKKYRRYGREFKLGAVARMQAGESPSALERELGVKRKLLYEWKKRVEQGGPENLRDRGRPGARAGPVVVEKPTANNAVSRSWSG